MPERPAAAPGAPALRVAFDHRIFVYQKHGGVSRYFCGIGEHLHEFGADLKVIAPFFVTDRLRSLPRGRVLGRHFQPDPRKQRAVQIFSEAMHRPLARAWNAKIVHETYFNRRRIAPARARIVVTVYDMIHELFPELFPGDVTREAKAASLARADHIICISESTRRDLLRFFPQVAERTSVTLLGFDSGFEAVAPGPVHTAPYILFVGMRGSYKNFDGLVSAYAQSRLPGEGIDLIAVGGGSLSGEEKQLIDALGVAPRVHHRTADDATLRQLYAGALLFACPSRYEGFGIPPLEAMAAGAPVVVTRASSLPEVCGEAAEYAEPDSSDSLTAALEAVALSPSRAASLRAAGREQCRRFSWRECARQTSLIYRALA